jgi:hypothetical protein
MGARLHPFAMSNWRIIRLELSRTGEFPAGSVSRGYLLRLPLSDDDQVDEAEFMQMPHRATVRRYWSSEPDEAGQILRSDPEWTMLCNGRPGRTLRLDARPVRLGQQVSVTDPDGATLPFRIASIR